VTDSYEWWRAALSGVFGPVHERDPQPGFYRLRRKGADEPVAIWRDENDAVICGVGADCAAADPMATWIAVAKHPVTEADYRARCETGRWPGEALPAAERGIGDNRPPASVAERIDEQVNAVAEWLQKTGEIASATDGDIAANMRGALLQLVKEAEAAHAVEKRPHLEAGRQVDAKWKPIIEKARAAADRLRAALTPWLKRLEKERRADAGLAIARGAEVARSDVAARAGGATGRKAALRTRRVARVTDYRAAMLFFESHAEMRALVERLAQKVAAAGGEMPGVEITEERTAA
jgi:hypothetical protein